jgi:hypothetical protein
MTKRNRLWLVALVVGGLLVALPGVAVAQTDAVSADTPSVSDVSDIDEIKHRALHAIDRRLHTIARLTRKVSESKSVTDEHAKKLLVDLEDAAEGLKELARKIKGAQTIEELRELVPLIATDFRIYRVVKPKVLQVLASDRVVAATGRLTELGDKLETLIARAADAGYDVTRPRILLARMRHNVAAAERLAAPVADKVVDLQPEDWPDPAKALLREGRARLGEASDHLHRARYQARKIMRWLRNLTDPAIDISEID